MLSILKIQYNNALFKAFYKFDNFNNLDTEFTVTCRKYPDSVHFQKISSKEFLILQND